MNFRVVPESDGWTRVTTETRVHVVDRPTQRQFAQVLAGYLPRKLDYPMELAAWHRNPGGPLGDCMDDRDCCAVH